MKPPLCSYEVHSHEYRDIGGRKKCDAVAMIRPCAHADHFYADFDARLKNFNKDLHIGFDLNMGRWCVYRWTPETEALEKGLGYVHRYMEIVVDMKWAIERKLRGGRHVMTFHYREPGDWVFRHLKSFKPGRLLGYNYWVADEMAEIEAEKKAKGDKDWKSFVDDWTDDVMSWADRGNPSVQRRSIVVPEKIGATK